MSKPKISRLEQFKGCLIGQCLGDAVGCRVEGYAEEVCQNYVNYELKVKRIRDRDRFPFPFAQYTDDSQLARELLQSYIACGRFDPEDYAQRIAAIFSEERIVGRGRSTEAAALRLAQGIPWQSAGEPPPSAGNGSAMRAAPIGLIFYNDPPQLIQAAVDQGRSTHQDPRCCAGSVAIAGAVALVLRGESVNPASFLSQLGEWTGQIEPILAGYLRDLIDWIDLPIEEAVRLISRAGIAPDHEQRWPGISPFVIGSVLWSLYSFLKTPEDYWETICTAIIVGGDVDTTAAMAGAISGAYLGLDAIPRELAVNLNDQGTWKFNELVQLAEQCYAVQCKYT